MCRLRPYISYAFFKFAHFYSQKVTEMPKMRTKQNKVTNTIHMNKNKICTRIIAN